jgi:hypothetical protein
MALLYLLSAARRFVCGRSIMHVRPQRTVGAKLLKALAGLLGFPAAEPAPVRVRR